MKQTVLILLIAGDWNFLADDEQRFSLKEADNGFVQAAAAPLHQHAAAWGRVLKGCADVHAGLLTHWSEQTLTASRTDRCLCSCPGWALTNMAVGVVSPRLETL